MELFRNPFPPKVRSFDVEDEGVTATFHYKRPRASEVMDSADTEVAADGTPVKKESKRAINERTIKQWIVHEDGTPFSDAEVTELIGMDVVVFGKFSTRLTELMGSPRTADGKPASADAAKKN
jgi:hypothetical protein